MEVAILVRRGKQHQHWIENAEMVQELLILNRLPEMRRDSEHHQCPYPEAQVLETSMRLTACFLRVF